MNDKLPLPDEQLLGTEVSGHVLECYGYTAEDMHAYADACVAQALVIAGRNCLESIEFARALALEEAAKLCETTIRAFLDNADIHDEFAWCAAAIRALKEQA
jgi:hypothetical protein